MFESIIGNDKIKEELTKLALSRKIPSSLLFIGNSGIGKKLIAREFAKMILCESKEPCCKKCKSCIQFESNNNPDFIEIIPDGNTIKIEQIREMQQKAYETPIVSNRKVFIIDDADTATKEAQNALLKTLEEPAEFLNIILIGSNESSFLSTIKSRCVIYHFETIPNEQIEKILKEKFKIEQISKNVLDAANGSIQKAILLSEKMELFDTIENTMNNIEHLNLIDALKKFDIIYKSQDDKYEILDYLNILLFKKAKENKKYLNCIQIVEETKKRLNANCNYNMTIDNMIMTIWEEIH